MSAVLALRAAQKAGARVFVRDGRLVVQSQGQLPNAVMAELRQHRDRLVEILLTPVQQPAPICVVCGRPQHVPDYVCPEPPSADVQYPVAAGWPGLEAACAAIRAAKVGVPRVDAQAA